MKCFLVFISAFISSVFFLSSQLYSNNNWIKINSPTTANLRNCVFTDSLNGWISGDSGIIIHTSDGGNSFIIQNSNIDFMINDLFFLNSRIGWAVANEFLFSGTTIIHTSNGGINWYSNLFPDSTKFFKSIFFLDSLTGYMGGFGGFIYKTTNSGISWTPCTVDSSEFSGFPINKIKFANNNIGFAAGGYIDAAGVIWRTTNAGFSWKAFNYSPEPFYDLFIKDSQYIISAGGDFEYGVQISTTSNGGINWYYESLMIFGEAHSIDFRTHIEAWMALAYSGTLAVTSNSGQNWISIPSKDSSELYSLTFPDSLHGYAVGNNGAILKYKPVIVSSSINYSSIPRNFFLSQNFPNPFNPVTKINFNITEMSNVSLVIYDLLGKEIKTLINNKKFYPGSYSIIFSAENYFLSSGIYFYEMSSGNQRQVKKMLLIK